MISLIIDTCTNNVVIGLLKDKEIIDQKIEVNDKTLSTNFTIWIQDMLNKNDLQLKDIDTIFVAIGPGSFTGIRVGVTFAKVLAWSLKKRVVPISSLELIASTSNSEVIVPLIDARRDYVFAGIYDKELNSLMKDKYILLTDLLEELKKYDNIQFISLDEFYFYVSKPHVDIRKVVNKHFLDEGVNPHSLNPNYLKKTEAEEKLTGA